MEGRTDASVAPVFLPERGTFPTITVIVFVLNAGPTIERALQSVTSSDQPSIELLVLDGGSTDGTVDIIRRFEEKISFWRSRPDGNASNAVNEGIERASGDIICLLPGDDWIEAGALHDVRAAFAENPELDVLSCGTRIVSVGEDGTLRVDAEFLTHSILDFRMENILRYPLTAGRFIRRRIYAAVGDYNAAYGSSNDLDFLVIVMIRKPQTQTLERLVYSYRRHPGSHTLSGNPNMVMSMMRNNIRLAEHHLESGMLNPDTAASLRGLHGRASTRLAWMFAKAGQPRTAFQTVNRAWTYNPFLPFKIIGWLLQKWTGYIPRG
jgi:glycosyltransferase involved in cell wall biosynthesis